MKLISPGLLAKLRRGAELQARANSETMLTAIATIGQDTAFELGLVASKITPEPVAISRGKESSPLGLFDDEPAQLRIRPQVLRRVKLVDYITALQKYGGPDENDSDKRQNDAAGNHVSGSDGCTEKRL